MGYLQEITERERKISEAFKGATPEILPDVKIECEVLNLKISDDECDICGAKCDDHGYYICDCYSPCCGAKMFPDSDICPDCHEYCI
jgi:hypothetical protein